ncbi:hypothetical protein TNCV_1312691 [Trichonephila clavipes]|nr:hypothetical protein TNCV_1312691 [Trichonephila clavipes]
MIRIEPDFALHNASRGSLWIIKHVFNLAVGGCLVRNAIALPSKTVYEAARAQEGRIRVFHLAKSSPSRQFCLKYEMLEPMDKREFCYTTTRFRTPLAYTDNREDCHILRQAFLGLTIYIGLTITADCTYTTCFCVCPYHSKATSCRIIAIAVLITCTTDITYSLLHMFERCHVRGDWTAIEWNQIVFSDESVFNLCSVDNRVSVGPRGERLNLAFPDSTSPNWCDCIGYHHIQHKITPYIDPQHQNSPEVRL